MAALDEPADCVFIHLFDTNKMDICTDTVMRFQQLYKASEDGKTLWGVPLSRIKFVLPSSAAEHHRLTNNAHLPLISVLRPFGIGTSEFPRIQVTQNCSFAYKSEIELALSFIRTYKISFISIYATQYLELERECSISSCNNASSHQNISTTKGSKASKLYILEITLKQGVKHQEEVKLYNHPEHSIQFLCNLILILTSPKLLPRLKRKSGLNMTKAKFKRLLLIRREAEIIELFPRLSSVQNRDNFYLMLAGERYNALETSVAQTREKALETCLTFNTTINSQDRKEILHKLVNGPSYIYVTPPFHCDYGMFTILMRGVYLNYNCIFLDCGGICIKSGTMLGPNVQIYTVEHDLSPKKRATAEELCASVEIGFDCWIGGNVTILSGVRIGNGVTIGAGSLVSNDIPSGTVAFGRPARVTKQLACKELDAYPSIQQLSFDTALS